jgi:hypothetical protein
MNAVIRFNMSMSMSSNLNITNSNSNSDMVTPGTPRPSIYGPVGPVGSFGGCGGGGVSMGGMTRFDARQNRHKKYVYRFPTKSKFGGGGGGGGGTSLRVCFNPKTQEAISILEKNVVMPPVTDMPRDDVTMLVEALRRCRIAVDVSTSLSPLVLQTLRDEAIQAEQDAKHKLDAIVYAFAKDDYETCKLKHNLATLWKDDLVAEMRRVNGMGPRSGGDSNWPTQHARLSVSSRVILRDILSKETLDRTFVSLRALSSAVVSEVSEFLKLPARDADRKLVVEQIKASYAEYLRKRKHAAKTQ